MGLRVAQPYCFLSKVIFIPQRVQSGPSLVEELANFFPNTQMASIPHINLFCSSERDPRLRDSVPRITGCFSIIKQQLLLIEHIIYAKSSTKSHTS